MHIDFARLRNNRWFKLAIVAAVIVALSLALMYLFNWLLAPVKDDLRQYAWLAYLVVFGVAMAANLTIVAPVYVFTPIMVAASDVYNPALIALAAALGGTIGEMSGYLAGSLGKKIVFSDYPEAYERVTGWVDKYGVFAIFFLALQPVFPFDVAGIVAGATKMPPHRFFIACLLGRFPKYLFTVYMFDVMQKYLEPYVPWIAIGIGVVLLVSLVAYLLISRRSPKKDQVL